MDVDRAYRECLKLPWYKQFAVIVFLSILFMLYMAFELYQELKEALKIPASWRRTADEKDWLKIWLLSHGKIQKKASEQCLKNLKILVLW